LQGEGINVLPEFVQSANLDPSLRRYSLLLPPLHQPEQGFLSSEAKSLEINRMQVGKTQDPQESKLMKKLKYKKWRRYGTL
jgi:hypothetical protein